MTDVDDVTEPTDGRVARRQRNIDAVLDVVMEMFAEEAMFPTIEQAATRSGLSLRSLYRYFADPGELLDAAIKRTSNKADELSRLPSIGQGPLESRIDDFAAMRLRLYDGVGPVFRATLANAARHQRVRTQLDINRERMREQFELQFAPELTRMDPGGRQAALGGGDLVTQLESVDFLRRHRGLTTDETNDVLVATLRALLS